MSEVLVDVDMLGLLAAADNVIPPLDACGVVALLSSYAGVSSAC